MELNLFKEEKLTTGYKMGVFLEGNKMVEKSVNESTVYLDVEIPQPRFWWPNGIGKPEMYEFEVKL